MLIPNRNYHGLFPTPKPTPTIKTIQSTGTTTTLTQIANQLQLTTTLKRLPNQTQPTPNPRLRHAMSRQHHDIHPRLAQPNQTKPHPTPKRHRRKSTLRIHKPTIKNNLFHQLDKNP